jgi:regulator of sigma E protease
MNMRFSRAWKGLPIILMVVAALTYPPVSRYAIPLLILGLIVAIHELGHLLGALAVGVKVHRYKIFFGPPLFEWSWRGIRMSVGTIPLGGFVQAKMHTEEGKPLEGDSIEERRWWQQIVFFSGGIVFNLVSAFLVSVAIMTCLGKPSMMSPAIVKSVVPDSVAQKAGILPGDRFTQINDRVVDSLQEYLEEKNKLSSGNVTFAVLRGQETLLLRASFDAKRPLGVLLEQGELVPCSFGESVRESLSFLGEHSKRFAGIMTGNLPRFGDLSGPIGIVSIGKQITSDGFNGLTRFFILISYAVALSNLLPIPALDGSYIVFALLKALRCEPSRKMREGMIITGALILIVLTFLISAKDVLALMR